MPPRFSYAQVCIIRHSVRGSGRKTRWAGMPRSHTRQRPWLQKASMLHHMPIPSGGDTYPLKEAVADAPKPDTVLRKRGHVSWPPMEALEEWIEEGPAHAARTAPEGARSSSNFAMGLPTLNMEEELAKRKARTERFGMTEGPPTAMGDTNKAEASAQVSPRKKGREDPKKGSQKAIRRNAGDGNRNIRGGGNNNTSGGGSKWNEQDRAAMEARKRRFGL